MKCVPTLGKYRNEPNKHAKIGMKSTLSKELLGRVVKKERKTSNCNYEGKCGTESWARAGQSRVWWGFRKLGRWAELGKGTKREQLYIQFFFFLCN